MTQTDPLEKQLEKLFSDVAVPAPGPVRRRCVPAAEARSTSASFPLPAVTPPPSQPGGRMQTPPQQSRRRIWWLGVPAIVAVLFLLLVGQETLASLADAAPARAPTLTSAHAKASDARLVFSGADSSTPTIPPATPRPSATMGATAVRVLPPTAQPAPTRPTGEEATAARAGRLVPTAVTAEEVQPAPTENLAPTGTADDKIELTPTTTIEPATTLQATMAIEPTQPPAPTATPRAPEATRPRADTLVIPAIELQAPIVAVSHETHMINGEPAYTWAVPAYKAVGWHQTSAPPGVPGNTVLNGHQYIHGGVLQDLERLQMGDEIIVHFANADHHYRVAEQHLLKEEGQPLAVRVANAQWILPTADERLTIVTCAPHSKSSHRLIVVAVPVQETTPSGNVGQ